MNDAWCMLKLDQSSAMAIQGGSMAETRGSGLLFLKI